MRRRTTRAFIVTSPNISARRCCFDLKTITTLRGRSATSSAVWNASIIVHRKGATPGGCRYWGSFLPDGDAGLCGERGKRQRGITELRVARRGSHHELQGGERAIQLKDVNRFRANAA